MDLCQRSYNGSLLLTRFQQSDMPSHCTRCNFSRGASQSQYGANEKSPVGQSVHWLLPSRVVCLPGSHALHRLGEVWAARNFPAEQSKQVAGDDGRDAVVLLAMMTCSGVASCDVALLVTTKAPVLSKPPPAIALTKWWRGSRNRPAGQRSTQAVRFGVDSFHGGHCSHSVNTGDGGERDADVEGGERDAIWIPTSAVSSGKRVKSCGEEADAWPPLVTLAPLVVLVPLVNRPLGHSSQWLLPLRYCAFPCAHAEHSTAPSCDAYRPGTQSLHLGVLMLYDPSPSLSRMSQCIPPCHFAIAAADRNLPRGHATHVSVLPPQNRPAVVRMKVQTASDSSQ
jgi:hypothetical protein